MIKSSVWSGVDRKRIESEWREFEQRGELNNHWDRRDWWPGREGYYWMIRFDRDKNVAHLAATCQKYLDTPAVDHVSRESLHMTLARVGFVDQMEAASAHDVASEVKTGLCNVTKFDLRIGPLAGSGGALRLVATPPLPMVTIRKSLLLAIGADEVTEFRPHVSVAYVNSRTPAEDLIRRARVARDNTQPAIAEIGTVELVVLRRDQRSYHIETIESIPLKQSS